MLLCGLRCPPCFADSRVGRGATICCRNGLEPPIFTILECPVRVPVWNWGQKPYRTLFWALIPRWHSDWTLWAREEALQQFLRLAEEPNQRDRLGNSAAMMSGVISLRKRLLQLTGKSRNRANHHVMQLLLHLEGLGSEDPSPKKNAHPTTWEFSAECCSSSLTGWVQRQKWQKQNQHSPARVTSIIEPGDGIQVRRPRPA